MLLLARIALDASGEISIRMAMIGMWQQPFGLNSLAFGNVMFGTSFTPYIPIPGFGKLCKIVYK